MMDMENRKKAGDKINLEEVNRLIEIGRILFSVLTPEEIEELRMEINPKSVIGNTDVS